MQIHDMNMSEFKIFDFYFQHIKSIVNFKRKNRTVQKFNFTSEYYNGAK